MTLAGERWAEASIAAGADAADAHAVGRAHDQLLHRRVGRLTVGPRARADGRRVDR